MNTVFRSLRQALNDCITNYDEHIYQKELLAVLRTKVWTEMKLAAVAQSEIDRIRTATENLSLEQFLCLLAYSLANVKPAGLPYLVMCLEMVSQSSPLRK